MRDEEVSTISFGTASASSTLYYKCHPFIWMLLMLMAVTLHRQYMDLCQDVDLSKAFANLRREDHIQRKVKDLGSENSVADLSSLVMSIIQSEVKPSFDSEQQPSLLRSALKQPIDAVAEEQPEISAERSKTEEFPASIQSEIVAPKVKQGNASEATPPTSLPDSTQTSATESNPRYDNTDAMHRNTTATGTSAPQVLKEAR